MLSRALLCALLSALPVVARAAAPSRPTPPPEKVPGQAYFGTDHFVEYLAGDLPIVITSPHGGRLRPDSIPNRTEGVREMDANTQELARALLDEFHARTGHRAHLIASHLHRVKLDPNREIKEAAQGNPIAERTWQEFHAAIRGALAAAVARHGFAFLIDLHGHGHPIQRIELGYALEARQLNQSDAAFDAAGLMELSTLRDLHARLGGSAATLLRGPGSLGDLFAARGIRAVPSPADPKPDGNPYFSGGYIVRVHAAAPDTPRVDGLQIETYRAGLRDTPAHRAHFAKVAVEALTVFLRDRYGFAMPVAARAK